MANSLTLPKALPSEFCANGDKNEILATPSAEQPQLANFSTGFDKITETPIPLGGKAPERADFNGLFNLLSSALFYQQNGGQWTFMPEVANLIGGYPKGAILNYYNSTTGVNQRVISNINDNVNNFLLDPSQIGDSSKPWSYVVDTGNFVTLDSEQTISGKKTFTQPTYGVSSSDAGSLITTASINKNGVGFLKLGNGIIFQWGIVLIPKIGGATISFQIPFSNTEYRITGTMIGASTAGDGRLYFHNKTNTWCVSDWTNANFQDWIDWIAIGY